jgi:hypothetical protein
MSSVFWFQMTKKARVRKERGPKSFVPPECSLCGRPVQLEISKADEFGKAVHEECYVLKVKQRNVNLFPLYLTGATTKYYIPHAKEPLP